MIFIFSDLFSSDNDEKHISFLCVEKIKHEINEVEVTTKSDL